MESPTVISILLIAFLVQYAASQAVQVPVSETFPPPSPPPPEPLGSACSSDMYNPCGLGSCINSVSNAYTCICPYGTKLGKRISGSSFCVPDDSGSTSYTTTSVDSCYIIALTFRITIATLTSQNPTLNCNGVNAGLVLNVASSAEDSETCWIRYTATNTDTCTSISRRFQTPTSTLQSLNPALDCSNLLGNTEAASICIKSSKEKSKFHVCKEYTPSTLASSRQCRLVAKSARRTQLFNPGLYCGHLGRSPRLYCKKAVGYDYFPSWGRTCASGKPYTLSSTDSCASLYSQFPGSSLSAKIDTFKSYNAQMDCKDTFLFIGQLVCVPS